MRGLLELPSEMVAEIMKRMNFRECMQFMGVSKSVRDKIRKEKYILHKFVLIQLQPRYGDTAFLAYEPASRTWHNTYLKFPWMSNMRFVKLVATTGSLFCFRRLATNELLLMNVDTNHEEILPRASAPNFIVVQVVNLGSKFKMVCFSENEEASLLQAWVYNSSIKSWAAKSKLHRVSIGKMFARGESRSVTFWDGRIWMLVECGLISYNIEQDKFSMHVGHHSLMHAFLVCSNNMLFVIGYKSMSKTLGKLTWEVVIWGFSHHSGLEMWSNFSSFPATHFWGSCIDGGQRIWLVGDNLKCWLEFDIITRKWSWLVDPPIIKTNVWLPLATSHANMEILG